MTAQNKSLSASNGMVKNQYHQVNSISQLKQNSIHNQYSILSHYVNANTLPTSVDEQNSLADNLIEDGQKKYLEGKFLPAYELFQSAFHLKNKLEDIKGQIQCLGCLADLFYKNGNVEQAMNYRLYALNKSELIVDEANIIKNLFHIGLLYIEIEDYDKAVEKLKEGIRLAENRRDYDQTALLAIELGRTYCKVQLAEQAIYYFEKALTIKKALAHHQELPQLLKDIGIAYQLDNQNEYGISYFKQSLELGFEVNDTKSIVLSLLNMASIYQEQENYEEAILYLQEAQYLVGTDNTLKRQVYEQMIVCYEKDKNYVAAFTTQKELLQLERIIYQELQVEELSKQAFNFGIEQKEEAAKYKQQLEVERQDIDEQLKTLMTSLELKKNELKGFLSVASHDLKEPLRMVQSFGQLLNRTYDGSERGKEYLSYIIDASHRMTTLLEDLLEFARMEKANHPLEAIPLSEVVAMVEHQMKKDLKASKGRILYDNLPIVSGHFNKMVLLFQKVIHNAIKFRRVSVPPAIQITAKEAGNYIVVSVRDNGIGMEERFLDQIFEPFVRLHTRRQYKGSGVGLATSAKIVELYGRKMWATSTVGQGTVFYMELDKGVE